MKETVLSHWKGKFRKAIEESFPDLAPAEVEAALEVTVSTQPEYGHYQCNAAMRLAKSLRKRPREIADQLATAMKGAEGVEKLEVAGAGFINLWLTPAFLGRRVNEILEDPSKPFALDSKNPKRIVIDFSSPNIAKEMHVGHLRSTIIGESLARLFERLGDNVLRLNHVGDWGTQFGMLIAYLKEEAPAVLEGKQETDLTHLVGWYKASKQRFDETPAFKKKAQTEVVALQGGDPASLKAWERICQISEKAYQEIYDLLGVTLETRGESFYNPHLPELARDLEARGIAERSDGALCIFLPGFANREGEPLPFMIQKSDGGFGYAATDMAAVRHRVQDEKAERVIYVTDAGQAQHFQMLFAAAEKAGYVDRSRVRLDHVPFGLVLGPDGKKFKTRSGDTEKLIDLLTTAVTKAEALMQERDAGPSGQALKSAATALGIGAIKYADLSCNRVSDYQFSYDKMLRFEGNTAAFLMYAYVRVNGIKRKVGVDPEKLIGTGEKIALSHPAEISLALQLVRFPDTLALVAEDLLPNRLCDYLYHLAQEFNAFFRDCRVEGAAEQNSRLLLAEATARVLREGFYILGLPLLERM